MKGETILRATGLSKESFPNFAATTITLFDSKNRIEERETVEYAENLFAHNEKEEAQFLEVLAKLEKNPAKSMNVLISEKHVVLFYQTPGCKIFSRYPGLIDFLD